MSAPQSTEEKKKEGEEEEKKPDEDEPKKKKAKTAGPMDMSLLEEHVFHTQNPMGFENNCAYTVFFAYLELMTLMCVQLPFARYKPLSEVGIRVHKCLNRLVTMFRRVGEDLANHDPEGKSSACLRMWFDMCKDLGLSDELPTWNESTKKLNCVGGIIKAIITPMASICEVGMQKMCSCAVASLDAGIPVRTTKPVYLSIRYIYT